jgi:hypothetical protein
MTALHIHAPSGYYLGQVRGAGCVKWRTVIKTRNSWRNAMAGAVKRMGDGDRHVRVIFCTSDGWYEPNVVMEAKR